NAGFDFASIQSVEVVDLYRNLGHQGALAVGIAHASNLEPVDYLVVMDSDEEDDPRYIPDLIGKCAAGDDLEIVFAERTERSEGPLFKACYKIYQGLYRLLSGMRIRAGNYCVVPWGQVDRVAHIAEIWSSLPAGIMKARLPYSWTPSKRGVRTHGASRMNFVNLIVHAFRGFGVHAEVVGARVFLLSMGLGAVIALFGLAILMVRLFTDLSIVGWTSQVLILLFILVFQMATAAVLLKFLVISMRMQYPLILANEYKKYIMTIREIFRNS
ncbi:MAG TPA: glycosyltransferase, partial [Rhodospirillales bacterium]|nr:glycosyltransferase [Rhodospirillales bacterium]